MSRPGVWLSLLCLNLALGLSPLGNLPIPDAGAAITVMHIPALLAGMLSGWIPGLLVGAVFGISSWAFFPPHDPLVQIVPRLLIGVVAALVFQAVQRSHAGGSQLSLGALAGALAGSLTNTFGCCFLALLRHLYPPDMLLRMALTHGTVEALLAVVIAVPVVVFAHHRS